LQVMLLLSLGLYFVMGVSGGLIFSWILFYSQGGHADRNRL
jgi:hypothetical protein